MCSKKTLLLIFLTSGKTGGFFMSGECDKCGEHCVDCHCKRIELCYSELSIRTTNALRLNGIYYVDELPKLSSREIIGWRNCGKKSLDDIRSFLAKRDLSLKDESINPDVQNMILKDLPGILDNIRKQVEEAVAEMRYFSFKLEQIATETKKKSHKIQD